MLIAWFDFLNYFYDYFIWFPWMNLFSDVWFLQFCIIYVLILLYQANNFYYILFYFFLEVFYFGVFLSLYQMEFFTGFLWLIECVVFYALLLLLFYINTVGNFNKINYSLLKLLFGGSVIGLFIIFINFSLLSEFEYFIPNELNINFIWDDFYESFNNNVMNDALSLLISYYFVNSFEFLILIIILLFGSLVCVNLNRCNKDFKLPKYNTLLSVFNFFKDWVDSVFIRKQNLTDQELNASATRTFTKKNKSV